VDDRENRKEETMDESNLRVVETRTSLCEDLGFVTTNDCSQLEAWLASRLVRDRFKVFKADCCEGQAPLGHAVPYMSTQALLDDSNQFSDILTKESKIELNWDKVTHYIWFVTGLVRSQRTRHLIWSNSGSEYGDLKGLCLLALRVLVSVPRTYIMI
jgi:hypothetical protein